MNRNAPCVHGGVLWMGGGADSSISLGSPQWFAWLDTHLSFRYELPGATVTVRKEKRPAGVYWYAYRRVDGRLRNCYVGRSEEVTPERLDTMAHALRSSGIVSADGATAHAASRANSSSRSTTPVFGPSNGELQAAQPLSDPPDLPVPLTPLIDREEESADVCALLRCPNVRLVSLVGTGGIGKTWLALKVATDLQAAEEFSDGVYFSSLAPVCEPDAALR